MKPPAGAETFYAWAEGISLHSGPFIFQADRHDAGKSSTGWSIPNSSAANQAGKCPVGPASPRRAPTVRRNMLGTARPSPKGPIRHRDFLPLSQRASRQQKGRQARVSMGFRTQPDDSDLMWPPFRSFGRDYYSYQLLLDLKVGKDWAVRTEPHPRFYTDRPARSDRRPRTVADRMVADNLVCDLQGADRGHHAYFPARRTDDANPGSTGDGRFQSGRHGRGGSRRTRIARAANSQQPPLPSAARNDMDVEPDTVSRHYRHLLRAARREARNKDRKRYRREKKQAGQKRTPACCPP